MLNYADTKKEWNKKTLHISQKKMPKRILLNVEDAQKQFVFMLKRLSLGCGWKGIAIENTRGKKRKSVHEYLSQYKMQQNEINRELFDFLLLLSMYISINALYTL